MVVTSLCSGWIRRREMASIELIMLGRKRYVCTLSSKQEGEAKLQEPNGSVKLINSQNKKRLFQKQELSNN